MPPSKLRYHYSGLTFSVLATVGVTIFMMYILDIPPFSTKTYPRSIKISDLINKQSETKNLKYVNKEYLSNPDENGDYTVDNINQNIIGTELYSLAPSTNGGKIPDDFLIYFPIPKSI